MRFSNALTFVTSWPRGAALILACSLLTSPAARAEGMLEDFAYLYPVQRYVISTEGEGISMAYMDVAPEGPANGKTVVALHGKNFCAATWEDAIRALAKAGYRIIAPDQVGFCKSSKPADDPMTFARLAANTKALLASLRVEQPIIMGHSMGGMLAIRYALLYPDAVRGLVLVNPIGLEDWVAKGVPPASINALFEAEKKTTRDSIKAYQQQSYYGGRWQPAYDRWVDMLASMYKSSCAEQVAWAQARAALMVMSEPVVQDFPRLTTRTLLLIGEKDRTAVGRDRAPPDVAEKLGNYPVLAREAAAAIPNARLVTFEDLGHSPQVEAPERFNAALLDALSSL